MSSTARNLLREALTAKLAAEIGRPHRATLAAEHAGRLAAQLVEELGDARACEEQRQHLDDDDFELQDLLEARYPPPAPGGGADDEPGDPT